MAVMGMALKSVPTGPLPNVDWLLTKEVVCRRLLLISTNVWSGPKPRKTAGSMCSVPSDADWRLEVKAGAVLVSNWLISVLSGVFLQCSNVNYINRHGCFEAGAAKVAATYNNHIV
jgi:hypothetical protein